MATTHPQVDQSHTTDDTTSQQLMKIQSTNLQLQSNLNQYPKELHMFILELKI